MTNIKSKAKKGTSIAPQPETRIYPSEKLSPEAIMRIAGDMIGEKGSTWEESDEVVEIEVKAPLDKVIPVRLSSNKWEQLRKEAQELGIGPTTLARMWILERLRKKTGSGV